MIATASGAQCLGSVPLDSASLVPEIASIIASGGERCSGYASGNWSKSIVCDRAGGERADLPYVLTVLEDTFNMRYVDCAQIFAAQGGGYVRPHRDWLPAQALYTRIHIPLQTADEAFNSEEDRLFHMRVGEIWFLDAGRPHSGGCFSEKTRLHLVVDLDPDVPFAHALRRDSYAPKTVASLPRPQFTAEHLGAIYALGAIANTDNLSTLADMLGTVHFDKAVSCAALYDWLIEIARRSKCAALLDRAVEYRAKYLLAGLA